MNEFVLATIPPLVVVLFNTPSAASTSPTLDYRLQDAEREDALNDNAAVSGVCKQHSLTMLPEWKVRTPAPSHPATSHPSSEAGVSLKGGAREQVELNGCCCLSLLSSNFAVELRLIGGGSLFGGQGVAIFSSS